MKNEKEKGRERIDFLITVLLGIFVGTVVFVLYKNTLEWYTIGITFNILLFVLIDIVILWRI